MNAVRPSALVTGASRGIGYGIAKRLAAQGWSLTINARAPEQLRAVQAELESIGGQVRAFPGDMSDDAALDPLVDFHAEVHRGMNALVLAAGMGTVGAIDGYPLARFDKQLRVNLRAPFALISRSLPLLLASAREDPQRGGRIIALASIEGVYPEPGLSAYGVSKAALISLMRSVNIEYGSSGITATAISPAFVNTDMSAWLSDKIPQETMIEVADVVKVVDLILTLSPNAVLPHIVINRGGASPYNA
jgi:3-oxoacyl-[acyl-carrier protein] reductase